jgi:hypothetical protein
VGLLRGVDTLSSRARYSRPLPTSRARSLCRARALSLPLSLSLSLQTPTSSDLDDQAIPSSTEDLLGSREGEGTVELVPRGGMSGGRALKLPGQVCFVNPVIVNTKKTEKKGEERESDGCAAVQGVYLVTPRTCLISEGEGAEVWV